MLKISSSCIRGSSIVFHSFEAVSSNIFFSWAAARDNRLTNDMSVSDLKLRDNSTCLRKPTPRSNCISNVKEAAAAGREELLASSIQIYGSAVWFCVNAAAAAEGVTRSAPVVGELRRDRRRWWATERGNNRRRATVVFSTVT
nr:hypothetical protein Iba_chr01aCG11970 [Ipomoea batatas]GMC98503.1 hypothetical protein Iba_chr05dCG17150 [Ipomoea batatas]GMD14876.1 hypothetical protein Iba_chr07bCG10650 [Ipomoea batatas]GMD26370.1 hypothetical protein Iba_chr08dCG3620 [Ipomoea batatas]GMD58408.1 hypothetical protein Iba_scaffold48285CG0010 [Ipomoea batatas]